MCSLKLKCVAGSNEIVLKLQNAFANAQTRPQFVAVERFRQVVIGSRIKGAHQVLASIFRGDQKDVSVCAALVGADSAAELQAVDFRHHPVQDQKLGRLLLLKDFPRGRAVVDSYDAMIPLLQPRLKDSTHHRIVFRNKYAGAQDRDGLGRFRKTCRVSIHFRA